MNSIPAKQSFIIENKVKRSFRAAQQILFVKSYIIIDKINMLFNWFNVILNKAITKHS